MASCSFTSNSIANYASLKPMTIMISYHYRHSYLFKTPLFASFSRFKSSGSSSFVTISIARKIPWGKFKVRSVAAPTESVAGFDEMVSGTQRKYYMLGGKGGVGKTSCAASLAVKFANNGHHTLVVSTDPAHSLSDSFAQDLTGGTLVPVEGPNSPLFALEINPEKAREEFRSASQKNGGSGVKDFMDGMGLGIIADQLGELKLGELLDTPPPGLDEAIAISKVIQFLESPEYSMFTRIVFDTAPTGHTLRLLSLPDFLDASIGKILKLRQKITSATSAIKSLFVQEENRQDAADKLEKLRERMIKVRELFRDTNSTEFVIVTIPTVMAISESSRLCASLKKESVPVKRLVVNQILPPSASDCKFCATKRKKSEVFLLFSFLGKLFGNENLLMQTSIWGWDSFMLEVPNLHRYGLSQYRVFALSQFNYLVKPEMGLLEAFESSFDSCFWENGHVGASFRASSCC